MYTPRVKYTFALGRRIKKLLENNPSWTYDEIAEELNIPRRRMAEVANYFGIKIQELRHKQIAEDYKSGLTYDEIAAKYNYSKPQIYRILKSAGLTKRKIRKRYRNLEKKLEELNYSLTKLAVYYKVDYRTIKKVVKEKGVYDLVLANRVKKSKNVKNRFYEFMKGRPIPKNNRWAFYKKMADYLDAGFDTVRKIASKYEKELTNKV